MARHHRPFEGCSGRIFRWLLDNGPAHAGTIADVLSMDVHHVITYMQRNQDLFIRLGKARIDDRWGYLWCVWED